MTSTNTLAKIRSISELEEISASWKTEGLTVVYCHGEFDLLHLGHMRYFKAARNFGDRLIVTLTPDRFIAKGPGRPVFEEELRAEAIANLAFVDYVGINEWPTAEETLRMIRPHIYVKGSEYLNKVDVTGRLEKERQLIQSLGGEMRFTHEIVFSSSKLLNNHLEVYSAASRDYLVGMSSKIDDVGVIAELDKIRQRNVVIIGPAVHVFHHTCKREKGSTGFDVRIDRSTMRPEGALQTANTLADMTARVSLFCWGGAQERQAIATSLPSKVELHFHEVSHSAPSAIVPNRYWDVDTACLLWGAKPPRSSGLSSVGEKALSDFIESNQNADTILFVEHPSQPNSVPNSSIEVVKEKGKHWGACIGGQTGEQVTDMLARFTGASFAGLCREVFTDPSCFPAKDFGAAVLVGEDLGNISCGKGGIEVLPVFVDSVPAVIPHDSLSAVFGLEAVMNQAGVAPFISSFAGNALREMTQHCQDDIFRPERMMLDKFLIALLNR